MRVPEPSPLPTNSQQLFTQALFSPSEVTSNIRVQPGERYLNIKAVKSNPLGFYIPQLYNCFSKTQDIHFKLVQYLFLLFIKLNLSREANKCIWHCYVWFELQHSNSCLLVSCVNARPSTLTDAQQEDGRHRNTLLAPFLSFL